jgi:hypothetical protein
MPLEAATTDSLPAGYDHSCPTELKADVAQDRLGAVRRDYETLPIGLCALTRRHRIRSDNQVRRRDKEGWLRNWRRSLFPPRAGRDRWQRVGRPSFPWAVIRERMRPIRSACAGLLSALG